MSGDKVLKLFLPAFAIWVSVAILIGIAGVTCVTECRSIEPVLRVVMLLYVGGTALAIASTAGLLIWKELRRQ